MAVILLMLFPFILMYNTPAGFVAIGVAIFLLGRGRTSGAASPRSPRRQVSDDASI